MEKLLTIITIMQHAGRKQLLPKLISRLAALVGLVVTTAIMVSAVLIGALMHLHISLLESGMSAPSALLIIGGASLFVIALLVTVIALQLRGLHRSPKKSLLLDTLDAFTDGLRAKR